MWRVLFCRFEGDVSERLSPAVSPPPPRRGRHVGQAMVHAALPLHRVPARGRLGVPQHRARAGGGEAQEGPRGAGQDME